MDEIKEIPVKVISYRGFEVPIYVDDPGQQFYCYWEGETLGFGSYNTNYEDDLRYIIDQKLDTIHYFDGPFFGAKLEWFDNGGYRDIRLLWRQRIVRVFLVEDQKPFNDLIRQEIIKRSEMELSKFLAVDARTRRQQIVGQIDYRD